MAAEPRIAVVFTQLGLGGAERQHFLLLRRLAERRHPWRPVLVACLSEDLDPYGPALRDLGYPLRVLPRARSFDLRRLLHLRRLFREERIDLCHAVHLLASGYCWLAARGGGPPVLPTVRGGVTGRGRLRRLLYALAFSRSPVILANSDRGREAVETAWGIPPGVIDVIPNGFDLGAIAREAAAPVLRRERGIPAGAPVVLYVGKRTPVKDIPLLAATLRLAMEADPSLHGAVAGIGLGEDARDPLFAALPRERLHLLGPRPDVPALLGDADALLLTSRSEGFPNVVVEALAAGVPVVSTAVGDVPRIVRDGVTGRVVPPGSPGELAAALGNVLAERDAFRARVRQDLPRLAARYGLDAMVDRTLAAWARLLALRARADGRTGRFPPSGAGGPRQGPGG